MARPRASHMQRALTSVLPRRRIRELAERYGVVRRRRKLDVVALVYSVVLGFGTGRRRSLTGLRRAYEQATGIRLASSSFQARFTRPLVVLMRCLALEALDGLGHARPALQGVFAPFREVLAIDSALLRLHDGLQKLYPSVWTHYMKASAKLTVVMNVVGRGPKSVTVTHGSRHDVHLLRVGPWVQGRLLIFDLGFYSAPLFEQLDRHGGYFLCRMKKQGNPVIERSHLPEQEHLVGQKLRDAQKCTDAELLDVHARMGYQRTHRRRPFFTNHTASFRCIAVYNPEARCWHRYVTNLPPAMLAAQHATAVYAARWEVELLFRELKSGYRLDQMPSRNPHVVQALIYAALLTLAASRRLHRTLTARWKLPKARVPFDRWFGLFAAVAERMLEAMFHRSGRAALLHRLETVLRHEALDPNRRRVPLACRAEMGLHAWR